MKERKKVQFGKQKTKKASHDTLNELKNYFIVTQLLQKDRLAFKRSNKRTNMNEANKEGRLSFKKQVRQADNNSFKVWKEMVKEID